MTRPTEKVASRSHLPDTTNVRGVLRRLPKLGVAGSNPVRRSTTASNRGVFCFGPVPARRPSYDLVGKKWSHPRSHMRPEWRVVHHDARRLVYTLERTQRFFRGPYWVATAETLYANNTEVMDDR